MRSAVGGEQLPGVGSPSLAALADGLALHLGDLRQHGEDQKTDTRRDRTERGHHDFDLLGHQRPHRRLDVQSIAAQPINGGDVQPVALADVFEQRGKAGSVAGQHRAADALINELLGEGLRRLPEQRTALRLNRLTAGRHAIIGNLTHSFSSWG